MDNEKLEIAVIGDLDAIKEQHKGIKSEGRFSLKINSIPYDERQIELFMAKYNPDVNYYGNQKRFSCVEDYGQPS